MKIQLSVGDRRVIDNTIKQHPTIQYLEHKDNFKFNVGDILIKSTKQWDRASGEYVWKRELASKDHAMFNRYVYVFEYKDVGFFKKLLKDGTTGKDTFCMASCLAESTKFELDPEYADHLLLGNSPEDFDAKIFYSREIDSRSKAQEINRKSGLKTNSLKEINNFFATLSGNTFYADRSNFIGTSVTEYIIQGKIKRKIHAALIPSWFKVKEDDTFFFEIKWNGYPVNSYEFAGKVLSVTKPICIKEL